MRKVCLLLLFLLMLSLKDTPGQCAGAATTIYYKGGIISMAQPTFEVRNVYGIKLVPKDATVKQSAKVAYFPCTIENLSNATNRINIEIVNPGAASGLVADLIMDSNRDGIHQAQEKSEQQSSIELGEGAVVHFFLRLKAPVEAKPGDVYSATIWASCQVKDGSGYIGDNGIIYGGDDQAQSIDTLVIQ